MRSRQVKKYILFFWWQFYWKGVQKIWNSKNDVIGQSEQQISKQETWQLTELTEEEEKSFKFYI